MRVGIVGGGWAGLAAAVQAHSQGHQVSLFEASRHWGGRARAVQLPWPDGLPNPAGQAHWRLDNGQHILIGAYTDTLALMARVGLRPSEHLCALPLNLRFADGGGLATPRWARRWPAPWDVLAATALAQGWGWRDKWGFLTHVARWQRQRFACAVDTSVADWCRGMPQRVLQDLIDPLCVAALNTPMQHASAQVFLRVLRDALLGAGTPPWRASDLLLPRSDLGRLFPEAAASWLTAHGAELRLGQRIAALQPTPHGWRLLQDGAAHAVDQVVLACPPEQAARLVGTAGASLPPEAERWCAQALGLRHESIATVYLHCPQPVAALADTPMVALRGGPAQFVFDRSQLGAAPPLAGTSTLLAAVASACDGDRDTLERAVLAQVQDELRVHGCTAVQTVVEKRATFACTPQLQRPAQAIAPGLWAAGDYVAGPYPATLEGAVRSGLAAARAVTAPG